MKAVEKRFQRIDPERNHKKFYEVSPELLLFGPTVSRRWDRIGCRRPRALTRQHETRKDALKNINAILKRGERKGYRVVQD